MAASKLFVKSWLGLKQAMRVEVWFQGHIWRPLLALPSKWRSRPIFQILVSQDGISLDGLADRHRIHAYAARRSFGRRWKHRREYLSLTPTGIRENPTAETESKTASSFTRMENGTTSLAIHSNFLFVNSEVEKQNSNLKYLQCNYIPLIVNMCKYTSVSRIIVSI